MRPLCNLLQSSCLQFSTVIFSFIFLTIVVTYLHFSRGSVVDPNSDKLGVFSYSMHNLISIGRKGRRLGDSQSPRLPDRVTQQRPSTAREAANPNLRQIHNANTMQNTKDMFNMMDRNTIKMQKKYDNANYTMQIHCSHLVHRLTRDYKSKAQTTTMQNTIQIQYDYITNMKKIQWKYNAGRRERGQ